MKIKLHFFSRNHKFCHFILAVVICLFMALLYRLAKNKPGDEFLPKHLQHLVQFGVQQAGSGDDTVLDLRAMLHRLSYDECRVAHTNDFGAVTCDTTLLVVHLHADLRRLQYLIMSLARVRYIENTLLVFSHGFYDVKINELIKSINFCKVMQIYYPYSVQANPNRFPGVVSHRECPPENNHTTCSGRCARLVERKHHWWWTAHHVFEVFEWSSIHRGLVVFLEENQYVSPDFLYMLQYAQRVFSYMPHVYVIDLGINQSCEHAQGAKDCSALQLKEWEPFENTALVFNRTVWQQVVALKNQYCFYNDTSWSRSIFNVFSKFPSGPAVAVTSHVPRVLSLGQGAGDDAHDVQLAAHEVWQRTRNAQLFPKRVRCGSVWENETARMTFTAAPRGGFNDKQDQHFCMNVLLSTTSLLDLDNNDDG